MAHLVTGYAGEEHIKSADQGSFNASFFGNGQSIMEIGNQFEALAVDNNTVRIKDGDLLMYGRHIRIEPSTYEDMVIESGTSGLKRIDLICMTYEKNASTGIEKAYLEVVKGTSSSGTPVAPDYTNGNILEGALKNQMPLYKVTINGIALESVVLIAKTIPTYKALAEKYEAEFKEACRTYLNSLNILDTLSAIVGNTTANQIAGALGVKELNTKVDTKQNSSTAITTSNIGSQTVAKANAVPWSGVTGKPSTYPPSSHTHDDRYYTEAEVNNIIANERIPVGGYFVGVQAPSYGTWSNVGYLFDIGSGTTRASGSLTVLETSTSVIRSIVLFKRTA